MIHFEKTLHLPPECRAGWNSLRQELANHDRLAIAYSGGVDSTFLVWFADRVMAKDVLAVMLVSPLASQRELIEARQTAHSVGFRLEELDLSETVDSDVAANPRTRCYSCKKSMFTHLLALCHRLGYPTVMDGTNADDLQQYRPGILALQELGVISPLARAGLTKAAIREISRLGGLPTWNKPSQACLATRVPYGVAITRELLARIERAEVFLMDLGCRQVRVRIHDQLARIELAPEDFPLLLDPAIRIKVIEHFHKIGFLHVTLDLGGYRSGSADVELK